MAVISAVLRLFAYLYHLVVAVFLLGVGLVALASGSVRVQMDMLPWGGSAMEVWLAVAGLFGLAAVLLAVSGKLRILLLLQAAGVLVVMLWGFFLSRYSFHTEDQFYFALYLTLGALLAFFGAVSMMRRRA